MDHCVGHSSESGLGALQTELAIHPTLTVSIGQRFFMTKWFTVNVGLQDYLYLEDYAAGGELINHLRLSRCFLFLSHIYV